MEFKKRPPIEEFLGGQYEFSKHAHQDMQHTIKIDHKKGLFPEKKVYFKDFTKLIQTV
jgi:hypothetical protein